MGSAELINVPINCLSEKAKAPQASIYIFRKWDFLFHFRYLFSDAVESNYATEHGLVYICVCVLVSHLRSSLSAP